MEWLLRLFKTEREKTIELFSDKEGEPAISKRRTPRYSWNIANVGVKHQSINKSIKKRRCVKLSFDPL